MSIAPRAIDWRFTMLAGALLLYGAAGSPTPDYPSIVEAVIAALLILSLSPATLSGIMRGRLPHGRVFFLPLLLFGLSVPLALSFVNGAQAAQTLRDLAAFLFLCLPVFLYPAERAGAFLHLCMALALLFALRVLGQAYGVLPPAAELHYLANSPLVLMSAIIGFGAAFQHAYARRLSWRSAAYALVSCACLAAMAVDMQRACIGAVISSLALFAVVGFIRAPERMVLPLAAAALAVWLGWEAMAAAWHGIAAKTALVGVNMRLEELAAVRERLDGPWWTLWFGAGWGARFDSPAVGGVTVGFTHSLLTSMLLKSGLTGMALTLAALAACAAALVRALPQAFIICVALAWAIAIPVFLYGSYKSLDFGLVLILALMAPHAIRRMDPSS